jgi:hypothetical protein
MHVSELIYNGNSDNVIFDCVDTWKGSVEHINEDGLIEFDWVEVWVEFGPF